MPFTIHRRRPVRIAGIVPALLLATPLLAAGQDRGADGRARNPGLSSWCETPVADRKAEEGCYTTAIGDIGTPPSGPIYWHLDLFPTPTRPTPTGCKRFYARAEARPRDGSRARPSHARARCLSRDSRAGPSLVTISGSVLRRIARLMCARPGGQGVWEWCGSWLPCRGRRHGRAGCGRSTP